MALLGMIGILGAFGAAAAPDHPYAAESLTGTAPYAIKGSPMGEIVLDVEIDSLLETGDLYMTVNFWTAQLTEALGLEFATVGTDGDTAGVAGTTATPNPIVQPAPGKGTGFRFYAISVSTNPSGTTDVPVAGVAGEVTAIDGITVTRARDGDPDDTAGVYKLVLTGDVSLPTISTTKNRVRIDLSNNLKVPNANAAIYRGDLYIYDNLGDARAAAAASSPGDVPGSYLVAGYSKLFEVKRKITAPTIVPHLATADVGYTRSAVTNPDDDSDELVSSGGPFRGFEAEGMSTKNVGVLATITLNEAIDNPATPADESMFLAAATGGEFGGTVNTGASFVVTSKTAGAFGFGNGAGDGRKGERKITGDNPKTADTTETNFVLNAGGPPKAFMVSSDKACEDNPLTLQAPNAAGVPTNINPLADENPTFAADATQASATVRGGGPFYFCVLVSENEVAIPVVGDDGDLDGYEITVTSRHGMTAGPATKHNAGSIDRNGTTVNITYLSVHPAYNQRLVIVNRGSREAEFWMDQFQTESGTMVMSDIRGTVGAGDRMVLRVQDHLTVNEGGMTRASGTINLTAPSNMIDVMTLQVHPGTGQIDTTIY